MTHSTITNPNLRVLFRGVVACHRPSRLSFQFKTLPRVQSTTKNKRRCSRTVRTKERRTTISLFLGGGRHRPRWRQMAKKKKNQIARTHDRRSQPASPRHPPRPRRFPALFVSGSSVSGFLSSFPPPHNTELHSPYAVATAAKPRGLFIFILSCLRL